MIYRVNLTTKINPKTLKKGSGIIVLEPEDYTIDQIKAIKAKGYKVLAYLSVGTIEKERPWWKDYSKYKLKQLPDWPKEYYIDVKKTAWRKFLADRAKKLKACGYSGWWCDNIDVYTEYKSTAMRTAIAAVLSGLQKLGGYVMINGGSEWIDDMIDIGAKLKTYIDGYTQEEVFSRITDYSGKGKFGKQKAADAKYYKTMLLKAEKRKVDGFMLEYTRDAKLKASIRAWGDKNKIGYCISEDVNL